ncbi:LexA family protein [Alistipes sp.]|uniref:LexA family protein n=1 Tax=Alistipes sp. TaxID=1872444 RepID=UPI003AEFD74A
MEPSEDRLKMYQPDYGHPEALPLAESGVHAGFPSPADDFLDGTLDLNGLVVKHPEATFFARVEGDSMQGEGISEGDILVVDKAVEPYDGCLAVAFIDGEFTLKRVRMEPDRILLMAANPKYKPIEVTAESRFMVWGVVRWILKSV